MEPSTFVRASEERSSILTSYRPPDRVRDRYWLHLLLFLLTLLSTVFAGGQWAGRVLLYDDANVWFNVDGQLPIGPAFLLDGLRFSLALLLFLSVHEFGHYFAARYHRVRTSLPYFIPLPLVGFGTLGAVIRIREPIPSTRKLFDIGAAGPIAGFVVALAFLLYALATLPPPSYMLDLGGHEQLKAFIQAYGRFPDQMLGDAPAGQTPVFGQTLLYWFLAQFFPNVPPMYEMYHYPVLFGTWLGLFFTALNLLPVGQLDGGHILYALVGPKWHARLARTFVLILLLSGAIGFLDDIVPWLHEAYPMLGAASWFILAGILYFFLNRVFNGNHRLIAPALVGLMLLAALALYVGPAAMQFGYVGWLVFCVLIVLLIRVDHPPVVHAEKLTPKRRALAFLSILIFVLCFSIRPIYIV